MRIKSFIIAGLITSVTVANEIPKRNELCLRSVFVDGKGELYALEAVSGKKKEKISTQISSSHFLTRSKDCRWVVGFGTQLIDLSKVQKPVDLGGEGYKTSPLFSPDSKWLLYNSTSDGHLYSVNLQTMARTKLAANATRCPYFLTTKDVLVDINQEDELWVYPLDGSRASLIDQLDFGSDSFVVAYDEASVFYAKEKDRKHVDVMKSDLKGISKTKVYETISSDPSYPGQQAFAVVSSSLPGNKLLVQETVYNKKFIGNIQLVDTVTGTSALIVTGLPNVVFFSFAPDFSRIFFSKGEEEEEPGELFSSNLDGSGKTSFGKSYTFEKLQFSNDGKRVFHHIVGKGLAISKLDGTDTKLLFNGNQLFGPQANLMSFSPDKSVIYNYQTNDDGFVELRASNTTDGSSKNILSTEWDLFPTRSMISPDGKSLLIVLERMPPSSEKTYHVHGLSFSDQKLFYLERLDESAVSNLRFGPPDGLNIVGGG